MSMVKVVFVIVSPGSRSSDVITDIGLPRAEMSKDCLSARMSEQTKLKAEAREGKRTSRRDGYMVVVVVAVVVCFRNRILLEFLVLLKGG